jgi:alpha-tubulin suppressor-like RCC1 family protein
MVALAARGRHTCALRKSGALACWGNNSDGQLGDGDRVDRPRGVPVAGLSDMSEVGTGLAFSCARKSSGQVMCWGSNEDGQLGDGRGAKPGSRSASPVAVKGLTDATQLSLGDSHACALRRTGTVSCWGLGGDGQLGAVVERSAQPVAVPGTAQTAEVASGSNHVCARKQNGAVFCWGRNTEGQLGDGASGSKIKPVAVKGLTDATLLVAGGNHTCARRRSGAVVCWGSNGQGQLGDGTTGTYAQRTPVIVVGLTDPTELALGKEHSCARSGDRVSCWGGNTSGQLGDGRNSGHPKPSPVTRLDGAVDLALGTAHTCALQRTGNVTCWGSDEHRALGPRRL